MTEELSAAPLQGHVIGPGACSVSISGPSRLPGRTTWYIEWLPKGYGPSLEDVTVCAFPHQDEWDDLGLKKYERPPLIEKVLAVIEQHYRDAALKET